MKSYIITISLALACQTIHLPAQSHFSSGLKNTSLYDAEAEKKKLEAERQKAAEEARIRAQIAEQERRQAEIERQLAREKREAEFNSFQRSTSSRSGQDIKVNAYGAGVNADQYGRPHVYRTQDGNKLDAIQQDGVKRDGYGYGVHIDQYGRPVRDSRP